MDLIAYARASTEDQELTLLDQEQKLRQYADLYGHRIVELIVESESAKTISKRDGFQRVLQLLRDGVGQGLLVYKIDRMVRDVGDGHHLLKLYFSDRAKHQRTLCSVMDHIDTRTANGRLLLNFLLSISQWEREVIAERTKSALAIKGRAGLRVGEIRYGYSLGDDGKTLVADDNEQRGLALMQQLRDDGWPLRRIAAELDKHGIKTKHGKSRWSAKVVAAILKRNA
jgi:DNA invertase Pin-like site-specific DNA recombinase